MTHGFHRRRYRRRRYHASAQAADDDRRQAEGHLAENQQLRLAGQSMLLIEHDMGLVLGICDRVVVLEFGQVIAEGAPEVVRKDPKVIAAYLGDGSTDLPADDSASAAETV